MKKLFGRDKAKVSKKAKGVNKEMLTICRSNHSSRRHSKHQLPHRSTSNDRWEVVDQHPPPLPPGASPPIPSPTARAPSPYTVAPGKQQQLPPQTLRKKTPQAVVLLNALEPANPMGHVRNRSEERASENGHFREKEREKEKKGGFWGIRDKDKDRDRERALEMDREVREREYQRERGRERERRDDENELTRKIGFLTATASEDWTLVLDVCDHASANEMNAKEAVRALRREFKYGEPAAQLAAARLWAIMLRNSSDTFISQSTSSKFLDTLENLLTSSRTSPVVRERVMDVLAAAAYASGSKKDAGFRGLWRRVKPRDKPEEGMPFDSDDVMFNPPLAGTRMDAAYEYDTNSINVPAGPFVTYQDATPTTPDTPPIKQPPRKGKNSENQTRPPNETKKSSDKSHRDHRHRIIPPDEDMRRLFQECKIGVGNANLLSEALAMATPEELKTPVISEFYKKCLDSQELIYTQIPWATAGAERSRAAKDQEVERERDRRRKNSGNTLSSVVPQYENESVTDLGAPVTTREEDLLADLLAANAHLLGALDLYKDLERVAVEREAEARSRVEVRMDSRQRQYFTEDGVLLQADMPGGAGGSSSRSRSPSPARIPVLHPLPNHPQLVGAAGDLTFQTPPVAVAGAQQQMLAPPPAAPHGPRLPGAGLSRTPSPGPAGELANGLAGMRIGGPREYSSSGRGSLDDGREREAYLDDDLDERPMQPSAKALGKRKVEPEPYDRMDSLDDDSSLGPKDNLDDRPSDSDEEDNSPAQLWQHMHHPVQHFVYDAAAERTQQRIREGHAHAVMVNGVH
ncbi:hypothetical protein DFH07DRAFT_1009170 [Mycena maculata]|uniref:VHS domain-containing protein n=1 Tax=Mycena maculata TaxID=230809 RepID=A0AAD7MIX2_9AGAR|nr:hypothetical protein DFH07DRAFT_1009170 [Mycena maculata]